MSEAYSRHICRLLAGSGLEPLPPTHSASQAGLGPQSDRLHVGADRAFGVAPDSAEDEAP
jgi:hypothetical protein